MHNPKNFISIYFHVLFNYLLYLIILIGFLTVVTGLMSGWSINLAADLIANFPKNASVTFGELSILTISAFFSALEVKHIGLGWICYGILLFTRLYYLNRPQSEWYQFSETIRFFWDFIVIVHPIIHYFFGGKFAERAAMTTEQQSTMRDVDEAARKRARKQRFNNYKNEYSTLSFQEQHDLHGQGVWSADDYAKKRMRD